MSGSHFVDRCYFWSYILALELMFHSKKKVWSCVQDFSVHIWRLCSPTWVFERLSGSEIIGLQGYRTTRTSRPPLVQTLRSFYLQHDDEHF